MDTGTVWRHIDTQRGELADLLDDLDSADPDCWQTPSLCTGWTVRHVAAHLTHSTLPMPRMLAEAARSGFRFDALVNRMAVGDRRQASEIAANLRGVVGSRRHPPGTTAEDPLADVLVHTQDICIPLGIDRPMPTAAAVVAAKRVWQRGFPFHARRRFAGVRLVDSDADFAVGQGRVVEMPIRELLLLLTGRPVETAERLS
ncbi:maleylpyruvate isomerase family mycothiol-dependent enzyme [Mycolicibacterium poriferae]|uniref:maleylpyruvate isomerase family mycothiol-dependent enzyme n=1 Tax=Mycolicibacterium poriferae TaxID=39694 RepID=UPI0024BABABF|nr:maleylpyruvate isomerase family mycothiol-dependent enzyme [Mycolicibacterium poriferae]